MQKKKSILTKQLQYSNKPCLSPAGNVEHVNAVQAVQEQQSFTVLPVSFFLHQYIKAVTSKEANKLRLSLLFFPLFVGHKPAVQHYPTSLFTGQVLLFYYILQCQSGQISRT